ncbi:mannan endo-1,6-alpha-mannosidase-like protein DCW1 precursor [Xylariales sp. AK1849]|nr:mannan endo-1,6-alpha-mannosidase-like protein DCW1 precursor [Xylariales sp. AK1849]
MSKLCRIVAALAFASRVASLELEINDEASIQQAAATVAKGLYVYHNPNSTAGDFNQPQPWFWWLSGNGWNGVLDYMVYTSDTTYQSDLLAALAENVGSNYDFVPADQGYWEANDDQVYWVYNALTALEYNYQALPCEASGGAECANSWLAISTNAFELFVSRWNNDSFTCGGGLKWQYNTNAAGYWYKNAVTNGGFFQTAARLARYTGNQTFADWATKIWDWSSAIGIVSADYHVFDGTWDGDDANCTTVSGDEWSYNSATYIHGAANMYALTTADEQAVWESRVQGLLAAATGTFFGPAANATDIMYEQKCELAGSCTTDQTSFKSSLSRWLGKTAVLVPSVSASIMSLLQTSAQGAAAGCSGYGNSTCGLKWYIDGFDGQSDFGVELSALEVINSLLVTYAPALAVASS